MKPKPALRKRDDERLVDGGSELRDDELLVDVKAGLRMIERLSGRWVEPKVARSEQVDSRWTTRP